MCNTAERSVVLDVAVCGHRPDGYEGERGVRAIVVIDDDARKKNKSKHGTGWGS